MSSSLPPQPPSEGWWRAASQPPAPPPPRPGRGGGRTAALVATVVVLGLIAVASLTVAVVESRRVDELASANADLQAEVDRLQGERAELLERLEAAEQQPAPDDPPAGSDDPLGELLEEFGGLLEEFGELPGLGGLGDLDEPVPAADCATGGPTAGRISGATLEEQYAQTVAAVEQLRGEPFAQVPVLQVLTPEELRSRLEQLIRDEYPAEAADADRRMLSLLGAVPADIDLQATQLDLLASQVVGFYDPDSGDMVVVDADGGTLGALELIALAHELGHALTDQLVGLPDLEVEPGEEDSALAGLALAEGDAVLLQLFFQASSIDPLDALSGLDEAAEAQAALDALPPYLAAELQWPYQAGPELVCSLYQQGGWERVTEALASPPTTTAQVLFPERYAAAEAGVDLPDPAAPAGFDEVAARGFGAASLGFLLAAPGGDVDAAIADADGLVAEWGGGEVTVWADGDRSALDLALFDREGGATLCGPITELARRTYPGAQESASSSTFVAPDRVVEVRCTSAGEVHIVIGPDAGVVAAIGG